MPSESAARDELLEINLRLIESIVSGDWETYEQLCDPTLTAFEPEARGCLAEGMDFHHFYFKLDGGGPRPHNITLAAPHVRVMGDVAVVSFIRLVQRLDAGGQPVTTRSEETRVWQRQNGQWRHVHFHRTPS